MREHVFGLADPDYYAPVDDLADRGRDFAPSKVPDGWETSLWGTWRSWRRPGQVLPEEGWKVHVSAGPARLPDMLDRFAEECFARGVAFKHVSGSRLLLLQQHKHADRSQSGKLLVAYPPDADAARGLMTALAVAFEGEQGQYILTDRRFGDSKVVHYRYGSFVPRRRLRPDGTSEALVRDGHGRLVPDLREPRFTLPAGIADPFAGAGGAADDAEESDDTFHGLEIEAALRHSNGGGTYVGHESATGRKVFVKEARDHTGLDGEGGTAVERLRTEWETLRAVHAVHPGLCPEPIAYFREWEHEFLVSEFVDGIPLNAWVAWQSKVLRIESSPEELDEWALRTEAVAAALEEQLGRLHEMGYVFGDVSPGNVLIDADDRPRLVDFEAACDRETGKVKLGTEHYTPPRDLVGGDLSIHDSYGVSGLVNLMLMPMHDVPNRNPASLEHLRFDLEERFTVLPASLWQRAVRYRKDPGTPLLPGPGDVAAEPERYVRELRDKVADALVEMADVNCSHRVFPSIPDGYATNTVCVAYGTAGVLHALRAAGVPVDPEIIARFRRDALAAADTLPPGLHVGSAGVAWVLADHGFVDEARDLLERATRHPLAAERATFAEGSAGIALAHLALFGHTGDDAHVDSALRVMTAVPDGAALARRLGGDDMTGWLHGRTGVAWTLYPLALISGEERLLDRGVALLHAELDRDLDPEAPALQVPTSATDARVMPYLYSGNAGMLRTVARYNRIRQDDRLLAAEPRLTPHLRTTYTVMAGLYQGLSGLGFTLAEHATLRGSEAEADRSAALRTARALFKYAVPGPTGVRFHGEQLRRFSADLVSGGAGILLFLDELLQPRPDRLFSLDQLIQQSPGTTRP